MFKPMHSAYPTRAWQTPEGESQMMDTSTRAMTALMIKAHRAKKQAPKKELPWHAMSKEEIPKFVQAAVISGGWAKWSSCCPIYCDTSKIDPRLILKARICYRWKPRGDGSFRPKLQGPEPGRTCPFSRRVFLHPAMGLEVPVVALHRIHAGVVHLSTGKTSPVACGTSRPGPLSRGPPPSAAASSTT